MRSLQRYLHGSLLSAFDMTSDINDININEKRVHSGHRERFRERILKTEFDNFSQHELLEFVLSYCIPRIDVNPIAHRLIDRFGSFSEVLDAEIDELCMVDGVGRRTAIFLHALPIVGRYYETDKLPSGERYDTVAKIGDFLRAKYIGVTFERVYLLLFDNSMRMIECCHIADGSINCAAVTVRKIVELALKHKASSAVLAHNHPKGLPMASGSDNDVARNIDAALSTVSIPLLEHIIVTEHSYAPSLVVQKGVLRCSPMTGQIDESFYRRFYGEFLN